MVVTGLEFHRSFWDIVTLLEGIKHPSMELRVSTIDYMESDLARHTGFLLGMPDRLGSLMISGVQPPVEGTEHRTVLDFRQTDNMYLTPRYAEHLLPIGFMIPARRAHLSADVIYYWFTLCMGHKVGETKRALSGKYALDTQKQMKIWLNTLDEFHKYIGLQG